MSGCIRQCDWDDNDVCRSCGTDYSPPKKLRPFHLAFPVDDLNKAKNEGKLLDIKFENIEYFSFDVSNKEIANLLDVKFQTTLLIYKDNKEVYRSLGETTEDLIYEALKKVI